MPRCQTCAKSTHALLHDVHRLHFDLLLENDNNYHNDVTNTPLTVSFASPAVKICLICFLVPESLL